MTQAPVLIGFGEAAQAFAGAARWGSGVRAYDIKTEDPALRAPKRDEYAAAGVEGCDSAAEAVRGAHLLLSLVTADQAGAAARSAANAIEADTLYCDMNSTSPAAKRAAEAAITAGGGRYVDVAIMAPVLPGRLAVPLSISGPHAEAAAAALAGAGFTTVAIAGPNVGDAATVKLIRSVVVKGMEALTAEALTAAARAGVVDAVLASLERDWPEQADYRLERMLVHGLRRAAEMEEAAATLEALGVEPCMTRGTIARQRALGTLGLQSPPQGIAAKLAAITAGEPA